jgi:hypothetical protein
VRLRAVAPPSLAILPPRSPGPKNRTVPCARDLSRGDDPPTFVPRRGDEAARQHSGRGYPCTPSNRIGSMR